MLAYIFQYSFIFFYSLMDKYFFYMYINNMENSKNGVTEEIVLKYLEAVIDPDLRMNIVELGLVYTVRIIDCEETQNNDCVRVDIDMTLTSPACPIAPQIQAATHARLLDIPQVEEAQVHLVFSPLWDPRIHASEDVQMELGIF